LGQFFGRQLFYDDYLTTQATFHSLAKRQADGIVGNVMVPGEIPVISSTTRLEYLRADGIDADAAWHIDSSANDEAIEGAVGSRGAGATANRVAIGYSTGNRERPAIVHVVDALQNEVDLCHDLLVDADHEIVLASFFDRTEVHMAHSTDHGIDFANSFVHGPDVVDVINVALHITARAADADNFMPIRERGNGRSSDGAGDAHYNYFHNGILPTRRCPPTAPT